MPRLLSEYILKGVYLGVLLFAALGDPSPRATVQLALFVGGGLVVALTVAAVQTLREGFRVKGRLLAFLLFLLLESPGLVYAGIILGLLLGAYSIHQRESDGWLALAAACGGALGVFFWLIRQISHRWIRLTVSLLLAVALAAGGLFWLSLEPSWLQSPESQTAFALRLLLGIALFYLLTFAGAAEESEIEIAGICAAVGVGGWMLAGDTPVAKSLSVLLPLGIYLVYTTRVLKGLRVFKHTVRGLNYANIGRYRPALVAIRRALELDSQNALARDPLAHASCHGFDPGGAGTRDACPHESRHVPGTRELIAAGIQARTGKATGSASSARPGIEPAAGIAPGDRLLAGGRADSRASLR